MSYPELPADKILVVDDDPDICEMLTEVLTREGYDATACMNSLEALELCDRQPFGLAFVDINLPDMNGLILAGKLKERHAQVEVVFITASGMIDHAVQAIKIGANDFLRKPFSLAEFGLCLKRYQERKALRKRIRRAEQRYSDLVQNIPLLIFVLRNDFKLEFINQACLPMLGYTPEEAVRDLQAFSELIYHEDRDRIVRPLQAIFESGGPAFSAECRLVHRKGHLIHTIVKFIPSRNDRDVPSVERLEGIIVDITDRVFLEKALVQKEKLKTLGIISAEVAHEIRNPLVSIGGFARRLQKKGVDLPEVGIILRESQRLEGILDRIRNYLKPVEIHHEACHVRSIIESSIDLLSPEINHRQIDCRVDIDPNQPPAYGDREILVQVCINLVRNALEAMEEGETLRIQSFESDHSIHIEFRNRTLKPSVKNPEILFLPFDEGGESIGLPLSYSLLKRMGGTLSYAEEQDEVVFTISLPKLATSDAAPGAVETPSSPLK